MTSSSSSKQGRNLDKAMCFVYAKSKLYKEMYFHVFNCLHITTDISHCGESEATASEGLRRDEDAFCKPESLLIHVRPSLPHCARARIKVAHQPPIRAHTEGAAAAATTRASLWSSQ